MPVFIVGGTGYIGRSVVHELRRRAHIVDVLVRNESAAKNLAGPGVELVPGEMRNLDVLRARAAHADAVILCAQEESPQGPELQRHAVEALVDALPDGKTFIYTSGSWVYGSRGDAVVAEDAPLAPLEIVAWRPGVEEIVLSHAGRLRSIVIRPGIVYGDGGGIPGSLVEQARHGTLRVVGDGANRWPTVRHDALAELYALAVERREANGIYNASRGAAIPYVEIAHAAARAAGGDGSVEHLSLEDARQQLGTFADALASDLQMDSTRALRDLGWEPHRPTLLEELSNTTVV